MKTVAEQISIMSAEFAALSVSRKRALAKKASEFIGKNPGCGDNNGFWRGLSARHVIAAAYK
jgi:hypothetical protein